VFVIHFGNYNLIAVASWLPLIFATFRFSLSRKAGEGRSGGLRCALGTGALWGMASLAGHAQMMLFIGLWLGGYALSATFCSLPFSRNRDAARGRAGEGMRARPLILFAITTLVAFGFAALMIIPANEMTRYTGRVGLDYGEATQYSLPPAALVGLVVPGLFGRGAGSWSPWLRVEVGYAGVLTLALAILGVALKRKREWRGERAFLAIAMLVAFLLAFGGYSALHGWLYRFVPLFGQLRAPARIVMLADFALAILAGLGLDALMSPLTRFARAVLQTLSRGIGWIAVGLAGIGLPVSYLLISLSAYDAGLAHRFSSVMNSVMLGVILLAASSLVLTARRRRWTTPARVGIIAVAVLAVDLIVLGSSVDVEKNDPTVGYNHPAVVDFLQRDQELFRIDSESASAWQSDAGVMHAVADIRGIFNPLGLAAYNTYLGGMGSRGSALYNFLNVKYVLAEKGNPPGDARFRLAFSGDPQIDVYLNAAALPRVMLVYKSIPVASGEQAWTAIHQAEFDPSRQVVVEGGPTLNGSPSGDALTVRHWDPNNIELDTATSIPAYIVLSEVYYPGWHAEVDGRAAKILPANFAFRALYLEPGTHRVRMFFQPASWTFGLAISAMTWFALLLTFVLRRRPAKHLDR